MSTEFVVLGGNGQLGRSFSSFLGERALCFSRAQIDLNKPDFVRALDGLQPRVLINAAAYTQVDKAEGEGKAEAFRVNAEAVGELASWCAARGVLLVHYSTDYVFDGSGDKPRTEEAAPAPLNHYGASKLAGEMAIAAAGGKYLIFRTSWLYDSQGKNFLTTMLRLFDEKESVSVVGDQFGAPTYVPHLAQATLSALTAETVSSGVYHLCSSGVTSWHGFAQSIFALAKKRDSGVRCRQVVSIPSSEYPTPAKRPLNSRLDCSKVMRLLGVGMPAWEEGLRECFAETYGH